MQRQYFILARFLTWSAKTAGKSISFVIALIILMSWIIVGLIMGFTDTWILIIDTIATINASLMVFIIQNTQVRELKALHIKIDGIIDAIESAKNELIAIEEAEEEELEKMREIFLKKRK